MSMTLICSLSLSLSLSYWKYIGHYCSCFILYFFLGVSLGIMFFATWDFFSMHFFMEKNMKFNLQALECHKEPINYFFSCFILC